MAFPTTGILDNFNRADGALGADWTEVAPTVAISSNQFAGDADGALAMYDVATYTDAEAYATVTVVPTGTAYMFIYVRATTLVAGTIDGYILQYTIVGTPNITLRRVDNGASTQLGDAYNYTVQANDVLGIRVVGTTITAYVNGTEVISTTDATYGSAGYIGLGIVSSAARFDNFGGGLAAREVSETESVTVGESVAAEIISEAADLEVSKTEGITAADSVAVALAGALGVDKAESVAVGESITVQVISEVTDLTVNGAENIAIGEAVTAALPGALMVNVNDAVTTGDAPTISKISVVLGIIGDSNLDSYRADNNRGGDYAAVTFNPIEMWVRIRPDEVDIGEWDVWGGTRRTDYEYNWARSSAVAGSVHNHFTGTYVGSLIELGMPTGVAGHITNDGVDTVIIMIGANDFHQWNGTYASIYDGTIAGEDLQDKIDSILANLTTAVTTVRNAGATFVLISNIPDIGPVIAGDFPNATFRQRVTDAIDEVNTGIAALAATYANVAMVNIHDFTSTIDSEYGITDNEFEIAGETITLTFGDEPHNAYLADFHTGTVVAAIEANNLFIDTLNNTFGAQLTRMTDQEIVSQITGLLLASVADAVTVSEIIAAALPDDLAISVGDSITAGEAIAMAMADLVVGKTEAIVVDDAAAVSLPDDLVISLTESVSVDEATIADVGDLVVSTLDEITVGETPALGLSGLEVAAAETTELVDSPLVVLSGLEITAGEDATVVDEAAVNVLDAGLITAGASDAVTVGEAVALALADLEALAGDEAGLEEIIGLYFGEPGGIEVGAAEAVVVEDSPVIWLSDLQALAAEAITVGESVGLFVTEAGLIEISVSEMAAAADEPALSVGLAIEAGDAAELSDEAGTVVAEAEPISITTGDGVATGETLALEMGALSAGASDGVSLADQAALLVLDPAEDLFISTGETALVGDTPAAGLLLTVAAVEAVTVGESAGIDPLMVIVAVLQAIAVAAEPALFGLAPPVKVDVTLSDSVVYRLYLSETTKD